MKTYCVALGAALLLTGCGNSKSPSRSADDITKTFQELTTTQGTGTGTGYSGTFTYEVTGGSADCSDAEIQKNASAGLATAKGVSLEVPCTQDGGKYLCTLSDLEMSGYIHKQGKFAVGKQEADQEKVGEIDFAMQGKVVLEGQFTVSDAGNARLRGFGTAQGGGRRATCSLELTFTFKKRAPTDAAKAETSASDRAYAYLSVSGNGRSAERLYSDVQTRMTSQGLEVRARGNRNEELIGKFEGSETQVYQSLSDAQGRGLRSGELRNCSHNITGTAKGRLVDFECGGTRGSFDLPSR